MSRTPTNKIDLPQLPACYARIGQMTTESERRDRIRERERERTAEGRNLYSDQNGEPVFRASVTAFLDLLGTKVALAGMTQPQLREQIELLDTLKNHLHDAALESQWQRILTFSDSIALAVPFKTSDKEIELGNTISSIGLYQFQLACTGRFLRGGIAIGNAYADYGNITGPALVEAAQLESEVAVVPRVLLSESASNSAIAEARIGYGDHPSRSPFNRALMVDADGRVFVNYLDVALEYEEEGVAEAVPLLQEHKKAVSNALDRHGSDPRVREKYVWIAHYHNFFCGLRLPGEELRIDKHLSQLETSYPRQFRQLFDPSAKT